MMTYLWIAVGGALGSMARYFVSSSFARATGEAFPWGTLVVNVTGCVLIGVLATVAGPDGRFEVDPDIRQFLLIGVCGGYTTFSSFSLQTLNLVRGGETAAALGNIAVSVFACLVGVWIGATIGQGLNHIRGG
jgi:CrcB protein